MNKEYQLVIFDWDGTLMDSTGRIVSSMQQTARLLGLNVPNSEQVKTTIGLSMSAVISKLFPSADEKLTTKIRELYRTQYVEVNTTPSPLFSRALELLEWLESHGIQTAVATGKARAGLIRALTAVNLENYFEHSICGDEAESKPHPEMVYRLIEETGNKPEKTLVVGDSIHDINMAHNASVDAVGVTTGACEYNVLIQLKPHSIIDCLSQLKNILR